NDTLTKDSIRMICYNPITNSSEVVSQDTHPTLIFDWKPDCRDIRREAYQIYIVLFNEKCLTNAFQSIALNILVESPLSLGHDTVICKNGILKLGSNITGNFTWNNNPTDSLQTFVAQAPGTYKLSVEIGSCTYIDSIKLTEINTFPPRLPGHDTLLCNWQSQEYFQLNASYQKDVKYYWNQSDKSSPYYYYTLDTGIIKYKAENVCGITLDSFHIARYQTPKVSLPQDTLLCTPLLWQLKAKANTSGKYNWNLAGSDSFLIVEKEGLYRVSLSNPCGESRDSIHISKLDPVQGIIQN